MTDVMGATPKSDRSFDPFVHVASPRVLLVADDRTVRDGVVAALQAEGWPVRVVGDGAAALDLAGSGWYPDVAVLDLLLPTREAYAIARAIRTAFGVPIVVSSPAADRRPPADADDVLARPVSPVAVVERVRTLIGGDRGLAGLLTFGDLVVAPQERRALVGGRAVQLTADESVLLTCLLASPGRPVERRALFAALRGVTRDADPRLVDVHLVRLMVKLGGRGRVRVNRSVAPDGYALQCNPPDSEPR